MHLPPSTSGRPAALRGLRRWPRLIAAVLTSTLAWPCLAACDLSTPKGLYQFLEHSDEEGRRLKARGTLAFDGAGALLIRGEVLSGKRAGPMHRVREYKVSRDCVISVEESGSFSWDLDIEGGNLTWYVQVKNEIFNGKAHRVGNLAPNVDREIRQAVQELLELPLAAAHYTNALEIFEEVGEARYLGLAKAGLAAVESLRGRLGQAEEMIAEATHVLTEVNDIGLLDAVDVYRGLVEWGHIMHTRSPAQARTLEVRAKKRIEHAERAGAPDDRHPAGAPSPADRSEHVRAALRTLKATMARFPAK